MDDPDDTNLNYADVEDENQEQRSEVEKSKPEVVDEQGQLGSDSDPELATEKDTLEEAQEMGLYPDADDDKPVPVGEHNE